MCICSFSVPLLMLFIDFKSKVVGKWMYFKLAKNPDVLSNVIKQFAIHEQVYKPRFANCYDCYASCYDWILQFTPPNSANAVSCFCNRGLCINVHYAAMKNLLNSPQVSNKCCMQV
ncbi:unnamed protein product [Orchesella dallaii]|uniref:Secreted protein n=1 Tax=Orchesella dallaii TaxID=48710 RepID=A0ABP1PMW2_9HEXA